VLTADKFDTLLPKVKALFDRVGFMEASSGTLFDKYLKQGAGAYPIIVAYENQLLEFAAEHPELIEPVRKRLRIPRCLDQADRHAQLEPTLTARRARGDDCAGAPAHRARGVRSLRSGWLPSGFMPDTISC